MLEGKPTFLGDGDAVRNAYPLYVTKAIYEGQRATRDGKRVVILTRSAFAGQQRNAAASWSGDVTANGSLFAGRFLQASASACLACHIGPQMLVGSFAPTINTLRTHTMSC